MLRFVDGFDLCDYRGSALKYTYASTGDAGAMVVGAGSPFGWWIFNTGFGEGDYTKIFDPQPFWCDGFDFAYYNQIGLGDNSPPVVTFWTVGTAAGSVLALKSRADFRIDLVRGTLCSNPGTVLMTTKDPFPLRSFGFLELRMTFGPKIGYALYYKDSLLKRMGGVFPDDDFADSNLSLGTSALPDRFTVRWQALGNKGFAIDNRYIVDGQGTQNNDRLGPCTVTTLRPTADVGTIDWTRNAAGAKFPAISENSHLSPFPAAPDGDVSYLAPNNADVRALFEIEASPCFGRNLGVVLNTVARPTSGTGQIQGLVKIRSTVYGLDTAKSVVAVGHYFNHNPLTDNYATYQAIAELSPVTGDVWIDGDISAANWGFKNGSRVEERVSQFYLEKLTSLRGVPYTCGLSSYSISK